MSYYYDEHDEDDLPQISVPMNNSSRSLSNSDDENDQANKLIENWRNLHETSIHSLQSDDDEPRLTNEKPFYLEQQPPNTDSNFIDERPESPDVDETNTINNKSKWEIRLPELLNSTVGPDRQKREASRRHTTNIVFQHQPEANTQSSETISNLPRTNPLVKQLTQKFDQMLVENTETQHRSQTPKLQRIGSLTCRGLTANTTERLVQRLPRPVLPIRPTPEIISTKSRSGSIGSTTSRTSTTRSHREKTGPPVSYSKHYYPPPSTTSVVRQLIDSGATLVYDSKSLKTSTINQTKSLIKTQRNIEQTREELINTNSALTGRQLKSKQMKNNNHQPTKTNDNSDDEYHDVQSSRPSFHRHRRSNSVTEQNHRKT